MNRLDLLSLMDGYSTIGERSQRDHDTVRKSILDHAGEAAHGTVREDLAKLDLRAQSIEHRLGTLEGHANKGERYTEDDAKRDLDLVMDILRQIRTDVRDLSARVRTLEQSINAAIPRQSRRDIIARKAIH